MSLQTKVQLLNTLKLNAEVLAVTDLKQQLTSLEKSTVAIQQRSISNRNKIRELDSRLLSLDSCINYGLNSVDTNIKELQKEIQRLQENDYKLWWFCVVTNAFTLTAFTLALIMWFR